MAELQSLISETCDLLANRPKETVGEILETLDLKTNQQINKLAKKMQHQTEKKGPSQQPAKKTRR